MVDIPDLPKHENFGKITIAEGTGPAYSNLATGLKRATLKSSSVLHPLKQYRKSIIKAFTPIYKRKIKQGGLTDIDQTKLYRKILALDDKTPNKDEDYVELKNAKFARDTLRYKLLKHFAKQPKIAARVQEQFSEDLPMGGKARHSLVDRWGTGDTLAKANRTTSSGIDDLIKKKSLKMNRLAQNNRLKQDYDNKFGYPLKSNTTVSINDRPKSPPPINLVN